MGMSVRPQHPHEGQWLALSALERACTLGQKLQRPPSTHQPHVPNTTVAAGVPSRIVVPGSHACTLGTTSQEANRGAGVLKCTHHSSQNYQLVSVGPKPPCSLFRKGPQNCARQHCWSHLCQSLKTIQLTLLAEHRPQPVLCASVLFVPPNWNHVADAGVNKPTRHSSTATEAVSLHPAPLQPGILHASVLLVPPHWGSGV